MQGCENDPTRDKCICSVVAKSGVKLPSLIHSTSIHLIDDTLTATTGTCTQSYSGLYVPDPRGRRKWNEGMNEGSKLHCTDGGASTWHAVRAAKP